MKSVSQLFLRLVLSVGFFLPVLDRLGLIGIPGSGFVSWGNWENFLKYTHSMLPFLPTSVANIFGLFATVLEFVLGVLLLFGFQTRMAALGSAMLTATFALFMTLSFGIGAPFKYPVLLFTGASLLLSTVDCYKWSTDNLLNFKIKC